MNNTVVGIHFYKKKINKNKQIVSQIVLKKNNITI